MKNRLDTVRFGSAGFLYIISFFILVNVFGTLCTDFVSLLSFVIFSLLLSFTVFPKHGVVPSGLTGYISFFLIAVTLLAGTALEIGTTVNVFEMSSDRAGTEAGKYVFSAIIVIVSSVCASFGKNTVVKMSNILFIIPIAAFAAIIPAVFGNGLYLEFTDLSPEKGIAGSVFFGIITSLITISDVYIISIMQIGEKCYKKKESLKSLFFTVMLMLTLSVIYTALFGKELYSELNIPLTSAVGAGRGFDFEEVTAFVYSVCLLYRIAVKASFVTGVIKEFSGKALSKLITVILFLAAGAFGVFSRGHEEIRTITDITVPILSFLSFFIMPMVTSSVKKMQNSGISCHGMTKKSQNK